VLIIPHAGHRVLLELERCQASVGAACHSHAGSKPSPILIACGVPEEIAINAMRLSVGRDTTKEDIITFVSDLTNAVKRLQQHSD
jgi:selenocysteine lyase